MIFIQSIRVKDIDFPYEVIIKRRNRNIYLRIKDGKIVITTPKKLSLDFIYGFILKNYESIYKSWIKPPLIMNTLHFFGKPYSLEILESSRNYILKEEDKIFIFTKKKENSYIQKLVTLFYAKELLKFVEKNILQIKFKFHIDYDITFDCKNVKTYFGECFPKRRHIILSTKLAKYEPIYILSVLYHEMGHFYYQNHSMQFYALLEQVFPNYKQIQKNLRKIRYNDAF